MALMKLITGFLTRYNPPAPHAYSVTLNLVNEIILISLIISVEHGPQKFLDGVTSWYLNKHKFSTLIQSNCLIQVRELTRQLATKTEEGDLQKDQVEHQLAEVERLGQDIGKKNKLISGLRDEIREHNNVQKSQSETIENLKVELFSLEVLYLFSSSIYAQW